ncbi:proton-conducting transporter transmembrane domain-containing protein [Candidatus Electrothrix sp.]|uniref:proton-conducting transporter transmembrane domain-containing protein n=1 Tax=Candidatus Electrothrix sp. TaxID=2170559 RepID=UPI0040578454
MLELTILIPLLAGGLIMFVPVQLGRKIMIATGLIHLLLSIATIINGTGPCMSRYFTATPEGLLILLVTSFIFFFISIYAVSYLQETEISSEPIYLGCTMLFLSSMSMVALADHLVVLWIAIEATTLMSAPLIFLHRSRTALEATWKYVMICSVGIALALLGCFLIVLSMDLGGVDVPITFSSLGQVAEQLDPTWLKAGFIFLIIGYGTKMGLAPMHTWLPDAHSEAPSPASALLSGALLNCAFLGVYRGHQLLHQAGLGDFSGNILMSFGLLSMIIAAIFIFDQTGYKRMLAYSSIENMGIIAFGVGVGGLATYGAMLHLIHHSLIKSSLFLSAGNILLGYGSKLIEKTGNMAKLFPKTFTAFFAGFAGISGFPPFGIFISEVLIIMGAFQQGRTLPALIFILALIFIFAGASRLVMKMSFGKFTDDILVEEKLIRVLPSYALLLTSFVLCLWLPDSLYETILSAIATVGGSING